MAALERYRLDDLRSFAAALASGVGLSPEFASRLASRLLWFDAVGAASFGIADLPNLLKRIQEHEIDPNAEGKMTIERPATAVLDGERGVPLLMLGKGADIAAEKARDVGVGLVRLQNVGAIGSAAEVAVGLAVGPFAAVIVGPEPTWTVSIPSQQGLPAVFDSALARTEAESGVRSDSSDSPFSALAARIAPWVSTFSKEDGWLIAAVSITAMEPVSSFHERVERAIKATGKGRAKGRRWLLPEELESRRLRSRERGVSIRPAAWKALMDWSERLGVVPPIAAE